MRRVQVKVGLVVALACVVVIAAACDAGDDSGASNWATAKNSSASLKCSGGVTFADPRRDVRESANGVRGLDIPNVDLVSIRVARRARSLCFAFTTAAPLKPRTEFEIYSQGLRRWGRDGVNYGLTQTFEVLLDEDGTLRVSNGETPDDQPRFIDAPVSIDGRELNLLLNRSLFETEARPFPHYAFGLAAWSG